ncbi:MAG TPA: methyltransferase domain-containing protein, partial [Saprospiraceae bacterium]|nr:methyltransferase domain-containing protein [Saprospiraceae bacterium]
MLDASLVQDQIIPPPHPIFTSVHVFTLFTEMMRKIDSPKILEVGSRAVTKDSLYQFLELGSPHQYTGLDIHDGPNVDKVGDAHELSAFFPGGHFDVIMSKSVFEHLAMPWKVVLEMNTVLKQNGLLFIHTLHTFPLHEKPWDFWRFSDEAWKVLLNKYTGFEIIETGMEYPCKIYHWAPGLGPFP